jgi:hypothetical protein
MSLEDPLWIATFRAIFRAPDDVAAMMIAENIAEKGGTDLDEEDGDRIDTLQVTNNTLNLQPEEMLTALRRARNILIKVRVGVCFELAKELDKQIHMLATRNGPGYELAGYDYGQFMDISAEVLGGDNPLER